MQLNCYAGYNVVVVKNGRRICGSGAALANAPLAQNKAYFEAKLQSSGQRYWLYLSAELHFISFIFYHCHQL